MKKVLILVLTIAFALAITACGNDLPETAAVEGAAGDDVVVEEETSADSGSDTLDPLEGEHLVSNGEYVCYDRFSGEEVSGAWIKVHDSNSSQIVLSYVTSAGNWGPVTVDLDSSGHGSVTLNGTTGEVTLDMTVSGSSINVDEIQGMGAMAYEFRHF